MRPRTFPRRAERRHALAPAPTTSEESMHAAAHPIRLSISCCCAAGFHLPAKLLQRHAALCHAALLPDDACVRREAGGLPLGAARRGGRHRAAALLGEHSDVSARPADVRSLSSRAMPHRPSEAPAAEQLCSCELAHLCQRTTRGSRPTKPARPPRPAGRPTAPPAQRRAAIVRGRHQDRGGARATAEGRGRGRRGGRGRGRLCVRGKLSRRAQLLAVVRLTPGPAGAGDGGKLVT